MTRRRHTPLWKVELSLAVSARRFKSRDPLWGSAAVQYPAGAQLSDGGAGWAGDEGRGGRGSLLGSLAWRPVYCAATCTSRSDSKMACGETMGSLSGTAACRP